MSSLQNQSSSPSEVSTQSRKASIAVLVYSTFGHVATLAKSVEDGIKETGADVQVFQFPETLSTEILGKMHANKAPISELPTITPAKMVEFDGYIIGSPTRFGRLSAQVSTFFDSTGKLWKSNALAGKFGGVFTAAAIQHGGIESTALTSLPFYAHHGIIFVPIGEMYPELSVNEEIIGSSSYGASTIVGATSKLDRPPTDNDLSVARKQGSAFAQVVNQYLRGAPKEGEAGQNGTSSSHAA